MFKAIAFTIALLASFSVHAIDQDEVPQPHNVIATGKNQPNEAKTDGADESEEHEPQKKGLSFSLGLTTDYIWRGVSQTHRSAAIQPEIDFDLPITESTALYAGVWASNVKYPNYPNAKVEMEYWIGATQELGAGFSATFEALFYDYPRERSLSYGEVSVTLGKSFDLPFKPELSVLESYAWDTYGTNTKSVYSDVTLKLSIPYDVKLTAHCGYSYFERQVADQNYRDWKFGISKQMAGTELEIAWYATNAEQYDRDGKGHVVFSATHHF